VWKNVVPELEAGFTTQITRATKTPTSDTGKAVKTKTR